MGGGIANEDIHNNDDQKDLEVTGVNLVGENKSQSFTIMKV